MIKENSKWVFIGGAWDDFTNPTPKGVTLENITKKLANVAAKKAAGVLKLGSIASKVYYLRLTFAKKIKIELRDYDCKSEGKYEKEHVAQYDIAIVKNLAVTFGGAPTDIWPKPDAMDTTQLVLPGGEQKYIEAGQAVIDDLESQDEWENDVGLQADPSPEE